MVSSHQTRDLEFFADSSNNPQNPPTIRCPDRTATAPQMSLLTLCVLLNRQSHVFLICVVLTYNDSRIILYKICPNQGNCMCKWLLVSLSTPRTSLSSSWEVFVLHGLGCKHWVAKSCTTTAYRWLFRDSLSSLRILWSAVIKSPKCSALGTTVPVRLLQEALVIFVFNQISQFGSFGKCVNTLCLPEHGSTFARGPIGSSWDDLEVSWLPCSGFLQGSVEVLSWT